MKHFIFLTLSLLLLAMATSCHSNEQNYRQAYNKPKQKKQESIGTETLAKIEAEKRRHNVAVYGDSLRLIRDYARVVDGKRDVAKRYSVVVAEFKQVINARAYRDRLKSEEGFESYVLQRSAPDTYLVVVKGFEKLDVAAAFIKNIHGYMKIKIMVPEPWVFEII